MRRSTSTRYAAAALLMSVFGIANADNQPFWKEGTVPRLTGEASASAKKAIGYFSSRDNSVANVTVRNFNSSRFGFCIVIH